MTDLIQRLRTWAGWCHVQNIKAEVQAVMYEAADELELFIEWKKVAMEEARCAEKEIERLRAALKEIAEMLIPGGGLAVDACMKAIARKALWNQIPRPLP